MLRLWILLISIHASAEPYCPTSKLVDRSNETLVATCIHTCSAISKRKSEEAQTYFKGKCTEFYENEKKGVGLGPVILKGMKQLGQCWAKGIGEAVIGLPRTVYTLALANAREGRTFVSHGEALKICADDPACRNHLAKSTIRYENSSNEEIAKLDSNEVLVQFHHDAPRVRDRCLGLLTQIKRKHNAIEWNYERHLAAYKDFAQAEPRCVDVLALEPPKPDVLPEPPFDEIKCLKESPFPYGCLTLIDKIAVGVVCHGDAFRNKLDDLTVDFCGDVISNVMPVPLLGPQTAWIKEVPKAAIVEEVVRNADSSGQMVKSELENVDQIRFVDDYKTQIYASPEQNANFIEIMDDAVSVGQANRTRVLEVENSIMKPLNSATKDKNLVTSLTNKHKEILLKNLDKIRSKYPDLKFDVYSDFKSVKVAIRKSDGTFTTASSDSLRADLDELIQSTNAEFAGEMKKLGIGPKDVGPPETWFKAGYGRTVDEAALAARRARKRPDNLMDFHTADVNDVMTKRLKTVEEARESLSKAPQFKALMDRKEGIALPTEEVFDLTRKSSSAEALAADLKKRFSLQSFDAKDAQQLKDYVAGVDEFSPTLLIGKRENVNLDDALEGATSADFLGLGAANLRATAAGIARKPDLVAALHGARGGEKQVTLLFRGKMERFKKIVGGNVRCSGDDCVSVTKMAMADEEKLKILDAVAGNAETRRVRMAFVGPRVPQEVRMQLAAHGEEIEKVLRKNLMGKIPPDKLKNLTFGLDMKTSTLDQGQVNLLVGRGRTLSAREREIVLETYAKSVGKYDAGTMQLRERNWHMIPGTAVFDPGEDPNEL